MAVINLYPEMNAKIADRLLESGDNEMLLYAGTYIKELESQLARCNAQQQSERVPVEEAAKILGLSISGVREHMDRGLFNPPIGYVTNISGKKRDFLIYRNMLNKYIGAEN